MPNRETQPTSEPAGASEGGEPDRAPAESAYKPLGEASSDLERAAEAGIRAIGIWRGEIAELRYAISAAPVASPSHRATMHACATVWAGDRRWFMQRLLDDTAGLVDDELAAAAAARAADLAIAPRVLARDAATRTTVYEHLGPDARWCRVDELVREETLDAAIAAKRALHRSPPLGVRRDPFAVVDSLLQTAHEHDAALPADQAWLSHQLDLIRAAVQAAGCDIAPCHGDGVASNVMLLGDGAVRLVDFDCAGDADPYYDLASLLVEAHPFEDGLRAALERAEGRCEEPLVARCRLYAIVDDLRWGIWGRVAAAITVRPTVEFFKYGEWRLLRARHNLRDRRFERWLREVRR